MIKVFSKFLYYFILTAAIIIAGVLIASLLPIPGNYRVLVVLSGSMEPTIPTGSIIITKPQDSYAVGDIITFGPDTKKQIPVTHRIAEIRQDSGEIAYITKGDANKTADTVLVRSREIHGTVIGHVPYVGYIIGAAKTPIGFSFIIILPALYIIIDEIRKIMREIIRMKKRENSS